MLTFSREHRCIEAAVAVASFPPTPLCISLSLPLFRSCSLCRLTVMKSWLLIKTPHPPSPPATVLACFLSPFSLSLSLQFLSLFPIPPIFPTPLILLLRSPAVPAPSVSHSVHLSSPVSSLFISSHPPFIPPHPFLSLSLSLSLISSPLSSPCLSSPRLPRLSSRNEQSLRNREERGEQDCC